MQPGSFERRTEHISGCGQLADCLGRSVISKPEGVTGMAADEGGWPPIPPTNADVCHYAPELPGVAPWPALTTTTTFKALPATQGGLGLYPS